MIVTEDVNGDNQKYGINHNAGRQGIRKQQAVEDFQKIEWYFEDFCETHDQLGINKSSISVRNYLQVYSHWKELTVGTKDSRDIGKYSMVSSNIKSILE